MNDIPEWNVPVFSEVRASFFMQNYTNDILEWKNDTLLQKFSQKQNLGKKTQHTMYKKPRKKPTHHEQQINLIITPSIASKKRQNDIAAETDKCKEGNHQGRFPSREAVKSPKHRKASE